MLKSLARVLLYRGQEEASASKLKKEEEETEK
jgi:hypothetical protein